MSRRFLATITALACTATTVHAQPSGDMSPPPAPPSAGLPVGSPSAVGDPTRAEYEAAFDLFIGGDLPRAAAAFDALAAHATDPDVASRARELARLARALIGHNVTFSTTAAAEAKADDNVDGRTSFIALTTLYGLYGGVVLIQDANIDDFRGGLVTVAATTAVGLFGSYFATKNVAISGAMSDAYALGMFEGFANGGLLADPVGLGTANQVQTTMLLSGAIGGVAGLAYASAVKPTRGQIAFAGTISELGSSTAGLGIGIMQPGFSTEADLTAIAAGTDLGLVAGLGFGRNLDWSVSRGRIVQLGVLLGGLVGLAAGALINGDNSYTERDEQLLSATTLAGLWLGFGVAVKATTDMRADSNYAPQTGPTAHVAPMVVPGGGGAMIAGSF